MPRKQRPSPEFGATVTALMQQRGLTQNALATELGVYGSDVGRWRKGGGISIENVRLMAQFFGVDADMLEGLAGYGVSNTGGVASNLPEEHQAEAQEHAAFYRRLLEEKVPRAMWKPYRDAVEALSAPFAQSATSPEPTPLEGKRKTRANNQPRTGANAQENKNNKAAEEPVDLDLTSPNLIPARTSALLALPVAQIRQAPVPQKVAA